MTDFPLRKTYSHLEYRHFLNEFIHKFMIWRVIFVSI